MSPGLILLQIVVTETIAREVADLVILDQHIALFRELAHELLAFRLRDIDRDRLLAAVRRAEIRGLARLFTLRVLQVRRRISARVIALQRPLDLDHFGAEVGEILRGPGRSEHAREIEHFDMG